MRNKKSTRKPRLKPRVSKNKVLKLPLWKDKKNLKALNLSVFEAQNHLMELIEDTETFGIVLEAPTSGGKSLLVSQLLAEAGLQCIQLGPYIEHTKRTAQAIAHMQKSHVGGKVGIVCSEKKSRLHRSMRIILGTDGSFTAVLRLLKKGKWALVIDEAHEGRIHQSQWFAIIDDLMERGYPIAKVIVTSATIDPVPYVEFLQRYGKCESVSLKGRPLEVEIVDESGKDVIEVALSQYERIKEYEAELGRPVEQATVLVALPKVSDCKKAVRKVSEVSPEIPAFMYNSEVESDERKRIIEKTGAKIVFGTSVVRTGATWGTHTVVVDSGLIRRPVFDGVASGLKTYPITGWELTQTAGRANRVAPPVGQKPLDKYIYCGEIPIEDLPRACEPEIRRMCLESVYLNLACLGISPVKARFPVMPSEAASEKALEYLKSHGLLDASNKPTKLGRQLNRLELPARKALALHHMMESGLGTGALLLTAITVTRGIINRRYHATKRLPYALFKSTWKSDYALNTLAYATAKDVHAICSELEDIDEILSKQGMSRLGFRQANGLYLSLEEELGHRCGKLAYKKCSDEWIVAVGEAVLRANLDRLYIAVEVESDTQDKARFCKTLQSVRDPERIIELGNSSGVRPKVGELVVADEFSVGDTEEIRAKNVSVLPLEAVARVFDSEIEKVTESVEDNGKSLVVQRYILNGVELGVRKVSDQT